MFLVAPSFQNYKIRSKEPFLVNGKLYVTVEHPNTKRPRNVRAYTESEYAKAYGKKIAKDDKKIPNLKHIRGFDNGYIIVIRNNREEDEDWLRQSLARYAIDVGWYIVSTETVPSDAPPHFKYLKLSWEEFHGEDEFHVKDEKELAAILKEKEKFGVSIL